MLYPELFRQLESVRWDMDKDIPWQSFDASRLSEEQAQTIKMNAITEWAALPATEMFLRDNRHDSDFSAFMSIWFFEEQKHSLVLMEYLRRFRPELAPTEQELHDIRFDFDPAPPLERGADAAGRGDDDPGVAVVEADGVVVLGDEEGAADVPGLGGEAGAFGGEPGLDSRHPRGDAVWTAAVSAQGPEGAELADRSGRVALNSGVDDREAGSDRAFADR